LIVRLDPGVVPSKVARREFGRWADFWRSAGEMGFAEPTTDKYARDIV